MDLRKHLLEAATLIAAAVLCAVVSNGIASRERKLALVGAYPNALKVPTEAATAPLETTLPSVAPMTATATVALPAPSTAPMTATVATTTAASTAATPPPKSAPAAARPAITTTTALAPAAADTLKRFQQHPDKAYVEIAYGDAAALHNAGALFLDARRTSVYEQGHIAGARPYSVWEADIDEKVKKLFAERSDPEQQALPIVAYCSGGECEDSHMLAQKLWGIQFNNVYVYKDGYPDWQKRGGAVRTGSTP